MKTKFSDLSNPLKIAVILAWIIGTMFVMLFMIGFINGILSSV